MSLQKICKYTEIFESCKSIQNPNDYDRARISIIQNSAISGLIESGAPFGIKDGAVIIEFESGMVSIPIANLYPYLSPKYQTYFSSLNNNQTQPHTNSALETYDSPQTPSAPAETPNSPSQNAQPQNTQANQNPQPQKAQTNQNPQPQKAQANQNPQPQNTQANQNPQPQKAQANQNPQPQNTQANQNPQPQNTQANQNPQPQNTQANQNPQPQKVQAREDVNTLNKSDITYERCNLELIHSNGSSMVFSVHSAPLFDTNSNEIIARLKLLGNNGAYMHTEYGNNLTFVYGNIQIFAARESTPDGSFTVKFWCNDPNVKINKLNIEKGGNNGNLVIYDDNLELRIYPFPNIRDKAAGKMVFGNNKNGEAAFLYYMNIYGNAIASSGSERKPEFIYENANLKLTAKWKDDTIAFTAIENN